MKNVNGIPDNIGIVRTPVTDQTVAEDIPYLITSVLLYFQVNGFRVNDN